MHIQIRNSILGIESRGFPTFNFEKSSEQGTTRSCIFGWVSGGVSRALEVCCRANLYIILYARNNTNYQEQEHDLRLGYGAVYWLQVFGVGDGLTSTKRSGQISQVAASDRAECWMAKATTIVAIHYQKWGESFWSPLACKNDCSLSHLDRLTFPLPIIYGPGVLHYLSPAVRPDDALPRLQKDQHIDLWSPEIRAKSTFKSSWTITGLHYQQSRCNFFKWMWGETLWTNRLLHISNTFAVFVIGWACDCSWSCPNNSHL